VNRLLIAIGILGLEIPALPNTLNLSTGVAGGATYTVVEENSYNLGATATAALVTPSDADWSKSWVPNSSTSAWVAYDPFHCCGADGFGNYSTTFVLTPGDVSTVALSGDWTLDDSGSLYLNGHQLGFLPDVSWGSLTPFIVAAGSSDFVVGTNTLSIDITDTDSFLEGVNLHGSLTGYIPVPEPSFFACLIVSLGLLMGLARRKKA
jgi:hypothetical protein